MYPVQSVTITMMLMSTRKCSLSVIIMSYIFSIPTSSFPALLEQMIGIDAPGIFAELN